ncbi:MAG: hypothetical protein ACYDBB_13080 [Armatimonadota bacterium]
MMPIERIPDWEQRLARQDAFWQCEIIDRPVVCISLHQPNPDYPWPQKTYPTIRDRWMDTQHVVDCALAGVMNTEYLGDALPMTFPNLGPEIFSAFFGCELEYSDGTAWAIPNLDTWADVPKIKFSEDNFYWKKILEMTDALLDAGKGLFYTGITDLHPGADAIVAFRDPLNMNMDMLDAVEEIKSLLPYLNETYYHVYDTYYRKLTAAGQAIGSWPGIVSTKKWYVPSNDFSCMISKEMFDDVFLPGIAEECRFYEASIYHLDGPDALRHLDSLLDIPELSAIQWVYGAGHGRATDWLHVHQRCQQAGKGIQLYLESDEVDLAIEQLRPEGVWMNIGGVQDREQAEALMKKVAAWR